MKLHQLRYLAAVAQSGLNITAAAQKLHTSQPGVSKQIKLLEDELGFQIFVREGRNLTRITPAGQQVIDRALRILQEAQSIRDLSTELRDEGRGSLPIGTTHTQARYVLPDVIRQFRDRYPNVRLNLHQGTSEQIAEMVAHDRSTARSPPAPTTCFPISPFAVLRLASHGHRSENTPPGERRETLIPQRWRAYPLITYTFSFTGPSSLHEAFAKAGLTPNIAITARDADVIQTYVRLGLGVGIVAHMALEEDDRDLVSIDASAPVRRTYDLDWLPPWNATAEIYVRLRAASRASPRPPLGGSRPSCGELGGVEQLFADIKLPER